MNFKTFLNPFEKLSPLLLILLGTAALLAQLFLAPLVGVHFEGFIGITKGAKMGYEIVSIELFASWIIGVALFFISGQVLSKSAIRIIDVMAFTAFSRIPFLFAIGCAALIDTNQWLFDSTLQLVLYTMIYLSMGWSLVWLYQGYQLCCNLKGVRLNISYAVVLLLGSILSHLAIPKIYLLIF